MPKNKKVNKLKPISSINDLRCKCDDDPLKEKYQQLAVIASDNLGGPSHPTLEQCFHWFDVNVMETDPEGGSDKGVVDEINFCIPLLK